MEAGLGHGASFTSNHTRAFRRDINNCKQCTVHCSQNYLRGILSTKGMECCISYRHTSKSSIWKRNNVKKYISLSEKWHDFTNHEKSDKIERTLIMDNLPYRGPLVGNLEQLGAGDEFRQLYRKTCEGLSQAWSTRITSLPLSQKLFQTCLPQMTMIWSPGQMSYKIAT